MECFCDVFNGFVYDDEIGDGWCFDCSTLSEGCAWCSYSAGDWICDKCKSVDQMLSADSTKCLDKI